MCLPRTSRSRLWLLGFASMKKQSICRLLMLFISPGSRAGPARPFLLWTSPRGGPASRSRQPLKCPQRQV
jgi:hypothetical protein